MQNDNLGLRLNLARKRRFRGGGSGETPVTPPPPPPPPPTSPQMEVTGNGLSIGAAQAPAFENNHTDFGDLTEGDPSVSRVFTIANDGSADLLVSFLEAPSGFTVTEGLTATIAPAASDTFTVELSTATVGSFSGFVSFLHNDSVNYPGANPFTFEVRGEIVAAAPPPPLAPDIAVTGNGAQILDGDAATSGTNHTAFGSTEQSSGTITRTFTISNPGSADLTLSSLTVPTGFTVVEGISATIAANGSDTFQVRLDDSVVGSKSGDISFATNVTGKNPFNFAIDGTVSPPPPPPPPPAEPSVSLSAPSAGGTSTSLPITVTATATANSPATGIASVQFRSGGVTFATDSSGPPWSVDWSPDNGTYSLDAVATDDLGGVATSTARTHTANVSPPSGTTLTTLTIHNSSTTAQATGFVTKAFAHQFKKADIPTGDYPQFQLTDGTAVPHTHWGKTEWPDGSWQMAGFILRVPSTVAAARSVTSSGSTLTAASHTGLANGDPVRFITTSALPTGIDWATTYYVRLGTGTTITVHTTSAGAIANTGAVATSGAGSGTHTLLPGIILNLKNGGAAPAASALTNADITGSSDLKIEGVGARNITGTNTSSLNTGIADGEIFDIGTGPVGRVLRVYQEFNDGVSDNTHAGAWHYVFQLQDGSSGKYGLRHMGRLQNGWTDVSGSLTGKAFLSLAVKDGGTTVHTLAKLVSTKTLTVLPCGLITANNVTNLVGYPGAMAVRITSSSTMPAGLSDTVAYYVNAWAGGRHALSFDAQTSNFTIGQTITGGTSGATAKIIGVEDLGSTGTLYLKNKTGAAFQDNEIITDPLGGSATVNGTISSPSNVISLYPTCRQAQLSDVGEIIVTSAGSGTISMEVVPQLDVFAGGPFTANAAGDYNFIAAGGSGAETTCDVITNRQYLIDTRWWGPRQNTVAATQSASIDYKFEAFQNYLYFLDTAGERRDIGYFPGYGFSHFHSQTPVELQRIKVHGLQHGLQVWSLRRDATKNPINLTSTAHANMGTGYGQSVWIKFGTYGSSGGFTPTIADQGRIWGAYDYAHMPMPSAYAYAVTAEPHYLDMVLDAANNGIAHESNGRGETINGTVYENVIWYNNASARANAWTTMTLAHARAFAPAAGWNGAPLVAYFDEILDDNLISNIAQKDSGNSFVQANRLQYASVNLVQTWQQAYWVTALCWLYGVTEKTSAKQCAEDFLTFWNGIRTNHGLHWMSTTSAMWHGGIPSTQTTWDNYYVSKVYGGVSVNAATDVFTYGLGTIGWEPQYGTPANGDHFLMSALDGSSFPGLSAATIYYLRDVDTGAKTFKLASTAALSDVVNATSNASQTDRDRIYGRTAPISNTTMNGSVGDTADQSWKLYSAVLWSHALGMTIPSGMKAAMDSYFASNMPTNSAFAQVVTYHFKDTF